MATMQELPTGTVTFLFTDVEGSTKLLQQLGDEYSAVLEEHARLIRSALEEGEGLEVSTEGDAFFCVFASAPHALRTAAAIQRAMAANPWPEGISVAVRMGLHSGEGVLGGDNYVGLDVHRAARIAAAGHGGQVLLSDTTRTLAAHALPDGVALRDLGEHRLKDLTHPEELYEVLIDGLPQEFPPLRTLDPVLHNLPIQLTSFLGRDAEVVEVRRAISQARLVTLTGPGGTGKTRLALEAAAAASGSIPDGVWFVALATITDPSLLATAIVEALGLRYAAGSPRDQIVQHFERRDALLLLDNFEQLLPAAPSATELLRDCPKLRILVTSRAALRVSGEQEVPISPLPAPESPKAATASDVVAQFPAVQLFVERALAARPGFILTDEDAVTVAAITARLDGLPLAIELAAALVKLLPPRSILDRLERSLDLLTGGPQDLPERQRSMREAIAWSYELLDDEPRRLLEHLAVFAGGGSYEMVEEVCAPDDRNMLFDALRTLVDQSLVVQSEDDGEPRFSMLGAIHDFALERLEARGEADEARRRHAEAFRAFAQEVDRGTRSPDEARWVGLVAREWDNLRAATTWAIDAGEKDLALSIVAALFRYALFRNRDELFRWADAALGLPDAASHPLFVVVCGVAGWGAALRGDLARAIELADRGLAAASEPDDPARVYPLEVHASVAMFEGRLDDGFRADRESGPLIQDPWEQTYALLGRSLMATYSGDTEGGLEAATRFLHEAETLRAPILVAWAHYAEGEALMHRDPRRAIPTFEEAVAIAESVDSRFLIGVAQVSLASLQARHGDALQALASFRDLIELWQRAGAWTQLWTTLRSVADALARLESFEAAAVAHTALMEAQTGPPVYGDDAERLARLSQTLDEQLGTEARARVEAHGRSLSDDEVVSFVVEEIDRLLAARESAPADPVPNAGSS